MFKSQIGIEMQPALREECVLLLSIIATYVSMSN